MPEGVKVLLNFFIKEIWSQIDKSQENLPQSKSFNGTSFFILLRVKRKELFLQPCAWKEALSQTRSINIVQKLIAIKIHAFRDVVSTKVIPIFGCGLEQTDSQDIVKLLYSIFLYSNVQIAVYTLKENGSHAMSAEGVAEFNTDNEIERYSEEFVLKNRELEKDFTKDSKACQPTCDEHLPLFCKKDHSNWLNENYLRNQPKDFTNFVEEFDFQYPNITNEQIIL